MSALEDVDERVTVHEQDFPLEASLEQLHLVGAILGHLQGRRVALVVRRRELACQALTDMERLEGLGELLDGNEPVRLVVAAPVLPLVLP